MLNTLLLNSYNIEANKLTLIDSHFGTEVFLLETDNKKYIVKTLPLQYISGIENEGYITEYLLNNNIKVAKFLKTNDGKYSVKSSNIQFHIQDFIEGETLQVNTAPDWFLNKSADTLGKIHKTLKNYDELGINFDKDFFNTNTTNQAIQHYSSKLNEAMQQDDNILILELENRLRHLKRISAFDIDVSKITYTNSHGDYHVGQIIAKDKELTIIDWTSACRLPAALEIIMSYVTADPTCKDGKIDCNKLKNYISQYSKHFTLTDYDLKIMPFIFYYQQLICHYPPPYGNEPNEFYKKICILINNFTDWLFKNVETLSIRLCN